MQVQQLDLLDYLILFRMQRSINDIFDELSCPNLATKYKQLGINQFKNDYLRDLVQIVPHLGPEFDVFTDDIEFRNKLIVPDEALAKLRKFQDLDRVFRIQLDRTTLFETIKKRELSVKDQKDKVIVAKANYYARCGGNHQKQAQRYDLLRIINNILYWSNNKITSKQCIAMSEYLKELKDVPAIRINDFVCENTGIDDAGLALILDGIIGQEYDFIVPNSSVVHRVLPLRSLTITHQEIGPKATEKIKAVMKDLLQINLSRLIFKNIQRQAETLNDLLCFMTYNGQYLQRLTLAHMNL